MTQDIKGVYSAAATPIEADGSPCFELLTAHCHGLLAEGCHGIALLGTTGEANNFSVDERMALLDAAYIREFLVISFYRALLAAIFLKQRP